MKWIQFKGPQRQKQTQEQNKKEWASSVGLCLRLKPQHPHHVKVSPRGRVTWTWIRLGLTVYGLVFHPHRTFASVDWLRDDHQESVSRWSLVSTPQLISAVCNQPSLPTSFYSVLVSISVFMALSTVFHSINSPENSPLSHFVLLALFLPNWSFQLHISLWKSPSALI